MREFATVATHFTLPGQIKVGLSVDLAFVYMPSRSAGKSISNRAFATIEPGPEAIINANTLSVMVYKSFTRAFPAFYF